MSGKIIVINITGSRGSKTINEEWHETHELAAL